MFNTATVTHPAPYSELCDTFRAAACAARRTQSGTVSLVDFHVFNSVPHGLVAELLAERGPAGVEDGLRHVRLRQLGSAHVADDDLSMAAHEPRADPVQLVLAAVGGFCVGRLYSPLSSRPLRFGGGQGG